MTLYISSLSIKSKQKRCRPNSSCIDINLKKDSLCTQPLNQILQFLYAVQVALHVLYALHYSNVQTVDPDLDQKCGLFTFTFETATWMTLFLMDTTKEEI